MGTLIDYVDWRGDLRFSRVPFGEVDGLILSMLSYFPFDGIAPPNDNSITLLGAMREYAKQNKGKKMNIGKFFPPELFTLAVKCAKSRRFGGMRLSHYINDIDTEAQRQFCAVTMQITKEDYFIAFRGTDDTLVGWKESFNMSFLKTIPAQSSALEYFTAIASDIEGRLYLGGHSKGGNLAVYSASLCPKELQDRITAVYNYDGPGFDTEFIESLGYSAVKDRIHSLVPQSSVIGMLLEHEENYEVVKSKANGIMQHTGHTWEVMGGSFFHLDTVTEDSRLIDEKLKDWLAALTLEEREQFVDTIYEALSSINDASTLTELSAEKLKLVKAWNNLDPKTKNLLLKCISILIKHNAITLKK